MHVTTQRVGKAWVLAVQGEVDIYTAPNLDEPLQAALSDGSDVIVDLSRVDFRDSSGLGVLDEGIKTARGGRWKRWASTCSTIQSWPGWWLTTGTSPSTSDWRRTYEKRATS